MSDPIFQRSLQDLIKGIRSHKRDPTSFISQAIAEIKAELRSTDPFLKAEAVRKLTYLQMIGFNVSWASFSIVEVMSQPRFAHKRIAYLAANQTFDENTDVILLTTNLFKKEFATTSMASQYEIGLAVNCLANIATKELARDCIGDLVLLMNHSRPYVRKKAILAMYKLYVKFPQGLRLTFDKLNDRLDDAEPAVVSTAVNVVCELANKNPKNYLAMAPKFFRLLTTSANNWMLIKVVKLLGSLVSEEPRLARKLLEPLSTIIENTSAKSLEYECIYTITEALPFSRREDGSEAKNAPAVIAMCSQHLRKFIEESDQNLKYLGLVGLCKLMRSSPRSVVEHRDLVLSCLSDDDVTIRGKALELLAGIVSKKSLVDLVRHLLAHAKKSEGAYRQEVIFKILSMCRKDKYSLVTDFCWYCSVLRELGSAHAGTHGTEVAEQLEEISLRVDAVRPLTVETMLGLLLDESLLLGHARETVQQVLRAAAWIVGEFSIIVAQIEADVAPESADDDEEEDETAFWIDSGGGREIRSAFRGQRLHARIIRTLLNARATTLPTHVQIVFLHGALKLFVSASSHCDLSELCEVVKAVREGLPLFVQSIDLEVQERASTFRQLLSELAVLSADWEESTEKVKHETAAASVVPQELLLLDLMPEYVPSAVREIDERGARAAIDKRRALGALTAERFYAVHSKAQRRVPLPSDVNLDVPLSNSALQRLLDVDIPSDLSISGLSLIREKEREREIIHSVFANRDAEVEMDSRFAQTTIFDDIRFDSEQKRPQALPSAARSVPVTEDVFMLSSISSQPKRSKEDSLSQLLGEGFEELTTQRKSRKKVSNKVAAAAKDIDMRDALPAGALSSEDESGRPSRRRVRGNRDEGDLTSVDITTPLRADEVLPQPTHRHASSEKSKEKKSKHRNADDHKDARHDKRSSKKKALAQDAGNDEGNSCDLLALDWQNQSPSAESQAVGAVAVSAALSSSSSSSASLYPQRLSCNDSRVTISYLATVKGDVCSIHWKVLNKYSDAISIALSWTQSSSVGSSERVELASALPSGGVSHGVKTSMTLKSSLTEDRLSIPCNVTIAPQVFVGSNSTTFPAVCVITAVNSFVPNRLNEQEFQEKLAKSSRKWASGSMELPFEGKSKSAFNALCSFLHAHLVESEHTKAAAMSAKTPAGCKIYVLAKISGSSNRMAVDIKCLGSSDVESKSVVSITLAALSDVVL